MFDSVRNIKPMAYAKIHRLGLIKGVYFSKAPALKPPRKTDIEAAVIEVIGIRGSYLYNDKDGVSVDKTDPTYVVVFRAIRQDTLKVSERNLC